jgi:cell division protein FtsI/penicillin-binding protein 2
MIAAAVLNQGVLYRPSVVRSVTMKESPGPVTTGTNDPVKNKDTAVEKIILFDPERDKVRVFSDDVAGQVKEAMKAVVERGTANAVFGELKEGREFYAKTGTAETEFYGDNSLFVGFVIFRDGTPLVFSVIVPRAGLGVKVAGKLTEDILRAVIDYENSKGKNW